MSNEYQLLIKYRCLKVWTTTGYYLSAEEFIKDNPHLAPFLKAKRLTIKRSLKTKRVRLPVFNSTKEN